ncbi:hypothetical protein [Enterococcus wangshanyuanii]|uniref:Uncharacterized protein n=1 Tax=Enterococcus wangshanyuanii TaxID=2005703 RepID=A0ABQ1PRI3_9ENTE|nr:hypothetical protein [Enterococcus wangshanyuanii]GGD02196.1 hypothetical protein GCM10011573_34620 [Enterococcus wangshanyuanii]
MNNVSTCFKYNETDAKLISQLMTVDSPKSLVFFQENEIYLSDYTYWFLLATMWVDDSAIASVSTWINLFSVKRANRKLSLMKPDELAMFNRLPNKLTVYRAHSKDETDWISYTLDLDTAREFATRKEVEEIVEYKIKRHDCLALFLRREEAEIICLNRKMARKVRVIQIKEAGEPNE